MAYPGNDGWFGRDEFAALYVKDPSSLDSVMKEMESCNGTQVNPAAAALQRADLTGYFNILAVHRAGKDAA